MLPYLIIALGVPALVMPVLAAASPRSWSRVLGLLAASYFFIALCLTTVLWCNTVFAVSDVSSLLDTVNGFLFGAAFLMAWATAFAVVALVRMRGRARG